MSDLVAKPSANALQGLSNVPIPVPYSSVTGLSLLLAQMSVSGNGMPYGRTISTSDFISGNYSFPTPDGYASSPYQLPMIEPSKWNVGSDVIAAYRPVELYQIGNKAHTNAQGIPVPADYMAAAFPIKIYPNEYVTADGNIAPMQLNQSVIIRIYKNPGVLINWSGSNIANNGLTNEAILNATELTFIVTNVNGAYTITEWITPDFVFAGISTLKTTAKNNFTAIINEMYERVAAALQSGVKVNEIRRFSRGFDFDDPNYLLCDGSTIDPEDYPDLSLLPAITRNTAFNRPSVPDSHTLRSMFASRERESFLLAIYYNGDNGMLQTYYSNNSGTTWQTGGVLDFMTITSIIDSNGRITIAGTDANTTPSGVIYTSANNGVSWNFAFSRASSYGGLLIKNNGRLIHVGYALGYSDDNGATWTFPNQGSYGITDIKENNGRLIIVGNVYGYSDNNGTSWTLTSSLVGSRIVVINSTTLLSIASNGAVYRSTDNGTSWTQISTITPITGLNSVTSAVINGRILIAGRTINDGQLRASDDGGVTWQTITLNGSVLAISLIYDVLLASTYVSYASARIYMSINGGETWTDTGMTTPGASVMQREGLRIIVNNLASSQSGAPLGDISELNNPKGTLPNLTDSDTHSYIKVSNDALRV